MLTWRCVVSKVILWHVWTIVRGEGWPHLPETHVPLELPAVTRCEHQHNRRQNRNICLDFTRKYEISHSNYTYKTISLNPTELYSDSCFAEGQLDSQGWRAAERRRHWRGRFWADGITDGTEVLQQKECLCPRHGTGGGGIQYNVGEVGRWWWCHDKWKMRLYIIVGLTQRGTLGRVSPLSEGGLTRWQTGNK